MSSEVTLTAKLSGFDKMQSALANTATSLNLLKAGADENKNAWGALADNLKIVGIAAEAGAAALTYFLSKSVSAAIESEDSIARLSASLSNVGVNYDQVSDSLEKFISQMEQASGFSDEELRGAMTRLVQITGDYDKSLSLMTLTSDIAKGAHIDLSQSAKIVGMALEGNTRGLMALGIKMKEGATPTQILTELMNRFSGSAEKMGNTTQGAINRLRNSFDNAQEAIGGVLTPAVQTFANVLANLIQKFVDAPPWVHKLTTGILVAATAFLGIGGLIAIAVASWPFLVAVVTAASGAFMALAGFVIGTVAPIVAMIVGITVLIGVAALVIRHFKEWLDVLKHLLDPLKMIVSFWKDVFTVGIRQAITNLKENFSESASNMKADFGKFKDGVSSDLSALSDKFNEAKEGVKGFFDEMGKTPEMPGGKPTGVGLGAEELNMDAMMGYYDSLDQGTQMTEETLSDWDKQWGDWYDKQTNWSKQFADEAINVWDSFASGVGDSIGRAIVFGEDMGEAMKNLLKNIAANIISFLIQMAIQYLLTTILMKAFGFAAGAGQIAIAGAQSFANTYASISAIPIWGPFMAPQMALAAQIATVAGGMGFMAAGAAAGGLDFVGATGTFMLHQGERVISPQQNRDLTSFLTDRGGSSGGMNASVYIPINAPTIFDESSAEEFAGIIEKHLRASARRRMG